VNNIKSAEMLLCARGHYPANQAEPRAAISCPTSFPHVIASAKNSYAPVAAQATMFCPISPEAYLLTGEGAIYKDYYWMKFVLILDSYILILFL
jgi:hypothetical protein